MKSLLGAVPELNLPAARGACFSGSTVTQLPQVRRFTERSPLLRRSAVSRDIQYIYNWKTCFLLGLLIIGIFIGIHLIVIECETHFPSVSRTLISTFLIVDRDEDGNFPFHLIDRDFWYKGDVISNLTALDSQVSRIFLSHTRSNFCFDFQMCLLLIRELSVSVFKLGGASR